MSQSTVGERLKFLADKLGMSVSAFSKSVGVPVTTTQNYIKRGTIPKSEYLVKITRRFEHINSDWLLTGEGEPFTESNSGIVSQAGNFNQSGAGNKQTIKGNRGNIIGTNHGGRVNQSTGMMPIMVESSDDVVYLKALVEQLRSQLADKDRIIQLLEKSK